MDEINVLSSVGTLGITLERPGLDVKCLCILQIECLLKVPSIYYTNDLPGHVTNVLYIGSKI